VPAMAPTAALPALRPASTRADGGPTPHHHQRLGHRGRLAFTRPQSQRLHLSTSSSTLIGAAWSCVDATLLSGLV
jgi:hypothetical protein